MLRLGKKNTYRQSISAKISFTSAFPWVSSRYLVTHSTRWSLKAPMINWWRMSGSKSQRMLARGNLAVNGYHGTTVSFNHINVLCSHLNLAINPPIMPQSSKQKGLHEWINECAWTWCTTTIQVIRGSCTTRADCHTCMVQRHTHSPTTPVLHNTSK